MKIASRKVTGFMLTLLAVFLSLPAMAQYAWIDANNVRHYSDMPPPASVPDSRIIRKPRVAGNSTLTYEPVSSASKTAVKADSSAAPAKAPPTIADKNADFQKRKMEQAEKDKKAEQEAKLTADKAEFCERAQGYKRSLESGHRIAQTDKSGERQYLSDEQRASELAKVKQDLAQCK